MKGDQWSAGWRIPAGSGRDSEIETAVDEAASILTNRREQKAPEKAA